MTWTTRLNGSARPLRRRARFVVRRFGLDVHRYLPSLDFDARRVRFLRESRISVVIDGGSNAGQWALGIREAGYSGPIVSFARSSSLAVATEVYCQ